MSYALKPICEMAISINMGSLFLLDKNTITFLSTSQYCTMFCSMHCFRQNRKLYISLDGNIQTKKV
jgi:hypothetical protein